MFPQKKKNNQENENTFITFEGKSFCKRDFFELELDLEKYCINLFN